MDIRIGITNTPREINFESNQSADDVEKIIADALSTGTAFVKLVDAKGKVYLIPTATLAYVEVGSETSRRVGFVA